jgi:hypothetical protein
LLAAGFFFATDVIVSAATGFINPKLSGMGEPFHQLPVQLRASSGNY